jgi:hypothetical protein
MRALLRWCPPFVVAGLLVFALTTPFWAGQAEVPDTKAADQKISAIVKTVINRGADMFNVYRDYAGCYRYYQGGLTVLHGMLEGQKDLQDAITKALAEAERAPSMTQRAFILRRALGAVWDKYNPKKGTRDKPVIDRRPEDKPPADKPSRDVPKDFKDVPKDKPPDKDKPADKPPADKPPADKDKSDKDKATDKSDKDKSDKDKPVPDKEEKPKDGDTKTHVSGKVTYKGKPVAGATVNFVSQQGKDNYNATVDADGAYTVKGIKPGKYGIAVVAMKPVDAKDAAAKKPVAIPDKYADVKQSGLLVEVKAGENDINLNLE